MISKQLVKYVAVGAGVGALAAGGAGAVALSAQRNTTTVVERTAVRAKSYPKPGPKPGSRPKAVHQAAEGYQGIGSPPQASYAPAVSDATVVAYMASENVTSCTFMQDFEEANYLASSHGFELPSSSPLWEAFTCSSATASYFVVYEKFSSQWVPTNRVQTS